MRESESFVLTLQKDKGTSESVKKRVNVKKIESIEEMLNEPYSKVTIELADNLKINEIKEILSNDGKTAIKLVINNKNRKASYSLENTRKFDLEHLKALKSKNYVIKITV